MRARLPRIAVAAGTALTSLVSCVALSVAGAAPGSASTVVTPGNFTGYGFDQCTAPGQSAMDAWLRSSPYWAVGIYISGDSRGCTSQPNLSPTWVDRQLASGWRLLPITLGPQAWCTTRPRYLHQVRISPDSSRSYDRARAQGRAEAVKTVRAARALGIAPRSTLWYDLEAFDTSPGTCRESALRFLSAWTWKLHDLGYVSGVYSSAASGIKMLDDARRYRPTSFDFPDQLWIADWNGRADVRTSYIGNTGWMPHRRVHQYRGGHDERHGGVTINIDNNWMDLGRGSSTAREGAHCGGAASWNFPSYPHLAVGDTGAAVSSLQCLLRVRGLYRGSVDGVFDAALGSAVRAYRLDRGMTARSDMTKPAWMVLLAQGPTPLQKYGAAGFATRRLQRALNAADAAGLRVTGVFEGTTAAAVRRYQGDHGLPRTGVVESTTWRLLTAGRR